MLAVAKDDRGCDCKSVGSLTGRETRGTSVQFSSVTQSCPTLRPHGLQHARPPCSSTNSRSLPKLVSIESVMPSNHLILCHPFFFSHLQSFPASGAFQISQLFTSGGQSPGVSASASVLPGRTQGIITWEMDMCSEEGWLAKLFQNVDSVEWT